MKKIFIEENIIAYQMSYEDDKKLGSNCYVLLDGQDALVIDALYPEFFEQIVKDLNEHDIKITHVLPSHYHPDHIEGIKLLSNVKVYGTSFGVETLNSFPYEEDEKKVMKPTVIIEPGEVVNFGSHQFRIEMARGHSVCSMLIDINETYIHVGDNYMTLDSGVASLPYVVWSGVEDHIKSLLAIKDKSNHKVFLSHGHMVSDMRDLYEGINDRLTYLQRILDSNNTISLEEAIKDLRTDFVNIGWRAYIK